MIEYTFDVDGHTIVSNSPACFKNPKECPHPDDADEMCAFMSKCQGD